MRKIIMVFTALLLLHSCTKFGKNITVTGRVVNPITGAGFEGVEIRILKIKKGLPGGFTSVKETTTDAEGHFEINHLGGTSSYSIMAQTTAEQINDEVRIFPNPATSSVSVASMKNKPIRSIEIYDLSGNLVLTQHQIDVARIELATNLHKGTYIMLIQLEGVLVREKLVIL